MSQQIKQPLTTALLTRNPALTQEQFSEHWFKHHAAIVTPYFLHSGLQYYAQIHGPLSPTSSSSLASDIELSNYHGAAELLTNPSSKPTPQCKLDYYNKVILVDEKKMLVSAALEHCVRIDEGSLIGSGEDEGRRVVNKDGKAAIEVPEDVMRIWRDYEVRGKADELN